MTDINQDEIKKLKAQMAKRAEAMPTRSDDVAGYWLPDEMDILCVPINVKLFDSSIDKTKVSALISVTLKSPTVIENADKEDKVKRIGKEGEIVGIWYKPGMRAIRDCAGVETYISQTGEKDTGKGNPMKVYTVKAEGGERLPIVEDTRVHSSNQATPFDVKQLAKGTAKGPKGPAADEGEENIPF